MPKPVNHLKNMQVCEINREAFDKIRALAKDGAPDLHAFKAIDPGSTAWRSTGLAQIHGDWLHSLDSYCYLMAVQFNERILPSKVRDEKLLAKVQKLQADEGRNIGKKEYAQLREEVELELLPKAFIKRTTVAVGFRLHNDIPLMFLFTSSSKKADDAFLVVRLALCDGEHSPLKGTELRAMRLMLQTNPQEVLTTLAGDGASNSSNAAHELLYTGDAIVLKSDEDKRTIRVKNRTVDAYEVQQLLAKGYKASELALRLTEDDHLVCTVTDKLVFKGIKVSTKATADNEGDAHGNDYLVMRQIMSFFDLLVEDAQGVARASFAEEEPDDDDDL